MGDLSIVLHGMDVKMEHLPPKRHSAALANGKLFLFGKKKRKKKSRKIALFF